MFIKICGLSTPETVTAAVMAGADAVGFLLAPGYPRTITPGQAAELHALVPASVETVGVFRNQPLEVVIRSARQAGVRAVQLHGDEPAGDALEIERAGFEVLRAFSAPAFAALGRQERAFWAGKRILVDAVDPGHGVPFDAALLDEAPPEGFWLLAGGLTASNVADLASQLRPDGVDVSSGVEESRGVKSPQLIEEFIAAARATPPARR